MRETESDLGLIARSLAAETGIVDHPELQNPVSSPETPQGEEETVTETLLGAAAEIGLPVNNLTPAVSEEAASPTISIPSLFESFYGVLAEIGIVSPVKNGEKPFHIPAEVTNFFKLSAAQATHLAASDTEPMVADKTRPETELALEDLLTDLAHTQEMAYSSFDCDDVFMAAMSATAWGETLEAIHGFSPKTAVEQARSILEDKDTPPCLRNQASDYVHNHFQSVKLAFISAGIERYQRNPDPTLGRQQGLRDLCGLLEKVTDRAFRAGETARLKQQIEGEIRARCEPSAPSTETALRLG